MLLPMGLFIFLAPLPSDGYAVAGERGEVVAVLCVATIVNIHQASWWH